MLFRSALRNREHEIEESCACLRNQLGNDDTIPETIDFKEGDRINIDTNVYKLQVVKTQKTIYQYSVEFEPEILNPRIMRAFLYQAICQPKENEPMGQNAKWQNIIYDDQKTLFSASENLEDDYKITPRRSQEDGQEKVVIVKVKKTREITSDDMQSLIMIYNIAFQKAYRTMGLQSFRRKWLNLSNNQRTGNFIIYSGFVPSISALNGGLSYLIDVGSKIERPGTLYDQIREGINNPRARQMLEETIRSFQLQTCHLKKPKMVSVTNIIWDKSPRNFEFTKTNPKTGESTNISIAQYYYEAYNIKCPDDDILIEEVHGGKNERRCLYPSSVLKIIGISDVEKRNFRIMKDIATVTRIEPNVRKQRLDRFISDLKNNQEASNFLSQWGFEVGESRKLTGYVIKPATLCLCDKRDNKTELPLDGTLGFQKSWKDYHLYKKPTMKSFILILFPKNYGNMGKVVSDFVKVSNGLGLNINEEQNLKKTCVNSNHPNGYKQTISYIIGEKGDVPSFIVCILPDQGKDRYNQIKMFLTVQIGIPSQCIKEESLRKNPLSILTNVAVQIAAKARGIPFKVSSRCLPVSHTMVVGLSLTTLRGNAPVCAGVATTDVELSQYYSRSSSLKTEKTIPDNFISNFMGNALENFKANTGSYPKRIVVYREGVGYGLMPKIKNTEVQSLVNIIHSVTGDENVSLAYLIAQKQSSIRILQKDDRYGLKSVKAGTVVTGDISAKGVAEFYLVSHNANQGSATPTRYTIIHHSPRTWTDDQLILLTHYQTLHYYNWAGSIRIPACLMYATRLAEFVRTSLGSNEPNENLTKHLQDRKSVV